MEELLLRIKAIMRRVGEESDQSNAHIFQVSDFVFDYNRQILTLNDSKQKLTSKESELLKLLCLSINNILDRSEALKKNLERR